MTPILASTRDLLQRYPVLFCDVWGVLHDGVREYAAAGDALERYRAGGGIVILLSNAPYPAATVAEVLAEKQVRRGAWDAIVPSGDITRAHIVERGYRDILHIGPGRSLPVFEGLGLSLVEFDKAQAIVCTGLDDDSDESGESYRPLLKRALASGMPFVCANPDIVVEVGSRMYLCAGAVAVVYEELGGDVYWAGKPHLPAYAKAIAVASEIAGRLIAPADVLAVGDSVGTDITGAQRAGIDALFIAGGIHRRALMSTGAVDPVATETLLSPFGAVVVGTAPNLAW